MNFREVKNGSSPRRYLWIHGNETTAATVLEEHMKTHRGLAMMVENPTREVFVENPRLKFDPNRMFTDIGLSRNLKKLNPEASEADQRTVMNMVAANREQLVRQVTPPPGGLLIALHNNRDYSVNDELANSNATSIPCPDDPHEFMLCTDLADYALLAKSPFNVVLQNQPKGDEDGSFSRLAAVRRMRYVNIEAAFAHGDQQKAMLNWIETNLA